MLFGRISLRNKNNNNIAHLHLIRLRKNLSRCCFFLLVCAFLSKGSYCRFRWWLIYIYIYISYISYIISNLISNTIYKSRNFSLQLRLCCHIGKKNLIFQPHLQLKSKTLYYFVSCSIWRINFRQMLNKNSNGEMN